MPVGRNEDAYNEDSDTPPHFADVSTTSPESGPFWVSPESAAPAQSTDSTPVADATQSEETVVEVEEELPAFDEKYLQEFLGMLWVGKLEKTFTWMSHEFKIRTLTTEEIIQVGMVHKQYTEVPLADIKAYQSAVVAACVVSLDGKELPVPIVMGTDLIEERFRYVTQKWYPWTIDAVYEEFLLLEATVGAIIAAMGKVVGSKVLTPG